MPAVTYLPDVSDAHIADYLSGYLAERLRLTQGPVAITVPGGATPFPIMEQLTSHDLDWQRLELWPGDDRLVPEDHPASNTGRIRGMFAPLGAHVVGLSETARPPRFDLAWLGMGTDGHIASLFPNTDPRVDDPLPVRRLTPDPLPPEAPFDRITLTLPSLLNSAALMFVVRGNQKRALFEAAARGENDLPIARLLGASRQAAITCFT